MKTKYIKMIGLLFVMMFLQSCQTLDDLYVGAVGLTDPDQVKLKTDVKWLNPQPNIRINNNRNVYCRVKNSSGADIDIKNKVRAKLVEEGFSLTTDINKAQYVVVADLRYFGEKNQKGYEGAIMGGALGGAVGAIVGHQSNRTTEGAALGAAALGLVGNVFSNRNKVVTLDMVVDLRIGERVGKPVRTNLGGSDSSSVGSHGSSHAGGHNHGNSKNRNYEDQRVQIEDDFLYHDNRLVVSATKLKLTVAEAKGVIIPRISNAVANVLP